MISVSDKFDKYSKIENLLQKKNTISPKITHNNRTCQFISNLIAKVLLFMEALSCSNQYKTIENPSKIQLLK